MTSMLSGIFLLGLWGPGRGLSMSGCSYEANSPAPLEGHIPDPRLVV